MLAARAARLFFKRALHVERLDHVQHDYFTEPPTGTGSKDFACQDSGLSQIVKLIVSSSEKILNNMNVVE